MIKAIQYNNNICFRGCYSETKVPQKTGSVKTFVHKTSFMRDFQILDFVQSDLRKNFPNGTHIADFACSQGQETHSIAMLLHDANQDKRFKITGFDIVPEAVNYAKRGLFILEPCGIERIFFENSPLSEKKRVIALRKVFDEHFEEMKFSQNQQNRHKLLQAFVAKNFPGNHAPIIGSKIVLAKPEHTQGIIDFRVADIRKVKDVLQAQKTGAVFFQNALYHVINSGGDDVPKIKPARDIFEQIHEILPDRGVLSLGCLPTDHLQEEDSKCHLKYQNGERMKVFDSSPIHNLLHQVGFEPIFYAKVNTDGILANSAPVAVPAVWRKIPKI